MQAASRINTSFNPALKLSGSRIAMAEKLVNAWLTEKEHGPIDVRFVKADINTQLPWNAKQLFEKDIEQLALLGVNEKGEGVAEVMGAALEITDRYVWPPLTATLILERDNKTYVYGRSEVTSLTQKELGIDKSDGIYAFVRRHMRTTYLPEFDFERYPTFYCLHRDASNVISRGQRITRQDIEAFNYSAVRDAVTLYGIRRVSPESRSIVFLPLMVGDMYVGMIVYTFEGFRNCDNEMAIIGEAGSGCFLLDWENLVMLHKIGDQTAYALVNKPISC